MPLGVAIGARVAGTFASKLSFVAEMEGVATEFGSLPAAAKRRFLSSRIASREDAGEADLEATGVMEVMNGEGVPELLAGRFFAGVDRASTELAMSSDATTR